MKLKASCAYVAFNWSWLFSSKTDMIFIFTNQIVLYTILKQCFCFNNQFVFGQPISIRSLLYKIIVLQHCFVFVFFMAYITVDTIIVLFLVNIFNWNETSIRQV